MSRINDLTEQFIFDSTDRVAVDKADLSPTKRMTNENYANGLFEYKKGVASDGFTKTGVYSFDGVNDEIEVPNNTSFHFGTGDGTFHLEIITPEVIPTSDEYFASRYSGSGNDEWEIRFRNDQIVFYIIASGLNHTAVVPYVLEPNKAYTLTYVFENGVSNTVFINGEKQTLSTDVTNAFDDNYDGQIYIGRQRRRGVYAKYIIKSFYLMNTALSDSQAIDIYNQGLGVKELPEGLKSNATLDLPKETARTDKWIDLSPYGNDGTVNGAELLTQTREKLEAQKVLFDDAWSKADGGVEFDGVGDAFIDTNGSNYEFGSGDGYINMVVEFTSLTENTIFMWRGTDSQNRVLVQYLYSLERMQFIVEIGNVLTHYALIDFTAELGKQYHLVITFENGVSNAFYVDGVNQTLISDTHDVMTENVGGNFQLARDGGATYYDSKIIEYRQGTRVLYDSDVAEFWNQGRPTEVLLTDETEYFAPNQVDNLGWYGANGSTLLPVGSPTILNDKDIVTTGIIRSQDQNVVLDQSFSSIYGGVEFDGIDDQYRLGDVADLDLDDFTIRVVMMIPQEPTSTEYIYGKQNTGSDRGWLLSVSASGIRFLIANGSSSLTVTVPLTDITYGEPFTYIIKGDRSADMTAYINGSEIASTDISSYVAESLSNSRNLRVATFHGATSGFFEGVIYDIKQFNMLYDLWNQGLPLLNVTPENLKGAVNGEQIHLKNDSIDNLYWYDQSGNDFDGDPQTSVPTVQSYNKFGEVTVGNHTIKSSDEGVIEFNSDIADVTNQVGLEDWVRVYNNTGSTITDGSAVYFNGNYNDDTPTVALASAASVSTSLSFIGIVTADIADGAYGFVTQRGKVRGLDTSGLSTSGVLFLSATAGEVTMTKPAHPNQVIVVGGVLNVDASDGIIFVNPSLALQRTIAVKSFSFTSQGIAAGTYFRGGYYDASTTDANLTQASTTITYGTANIAYAAHPFAVFGGAGTVDTGQVGLRVNGTSIDDDGNLVTSDTDIITDDITSVSLNDYLEAKKFVGTVTYELYVVDGTPTTYSLDFNYGYAKYEDLGNRDFYLMSTECIGLAGANDTSFNIELLHHKITGWTYAATGFIAGNSEIVSMSTDMNPYDDLSSGVDFAWKHTDINQFISGGGSEGVIFRITCGANNSVQAMDMHLGFAVDDSA